MPVVLIKGVICPIPPDLLMLGFLGPPCYKKIQNHGHEDCQVSHKKQRYPILLIIG